MWFSFTSLDHMHKQRNRNGKYPGLFQLEETNQVLMGVWVWCTILWPFLSGDTWWPERQRNKQGIISEVFYIFGFYPVIFLNQEF